MHTYTYILKQNWLLHSHKPTKPWQHWVITRALLQNLSENPETNLRTIHQSPEMRPPGTHWAPWKALNLFLCRIHLGMALPHSTRGVPGLDTRRGTTGMNYAPSICVCVCLLVFSVCVNVSLFCGCRGFLLFLGLFPACPHHTSWASISLLDTHGWGEGESLGVSQAPRVLKALRRGRMTFNQGSGALAAAGGPQEPWLCPSPQVTLSAGRPPWARTLRQT